MADNRAALESLARHHGIAPAWHDIWGHLHPVADSSLVALLGELGIDASHRERIEAAARAAGDAAWDAGLPPVLVISAGNASWSLRLRLPASAGRLRWTIVEEGGARHAGEVDAAALPETARAQFDEGERVERQLGFTLPLAAGYHRVAIDGLPGETLLVAAPARC